MTSENRYYVSNKKLFEVFCEHLKEVNAAKESGEKIPTMPPYIAESILKISRKYANRPNFIGYSFREEMISDAIEMCCRNYLKFNPEKSSNPFAYLTQFCHNSFLQRINKEKKQTSIKSKYIHHALDEEFMYTDSHDDGEFKNSMIEFLRENAVFSDSIAEKKSKKAESKKKETNTLEDFFGTKEDE